MTQNVSVQIEGLNNEILIAKNIEQKINVTINNLGILDLTNVVFSLSNLDQGYYNISPVKISRIKAGSSAIFTIDFLISDFTGEKDFTYNLSSDEIQKGGNAKMNVLLPADYIANEIQLLKYKSKLLRSQTDSEIILTELDGCDSNITQTEKFLKNSDIIDAKDQLDQSANCLNNVENMINGNKNNNVINIGGYGISFILLAVIIILLVIIGLIIYITYRKIDVLSFIKKGDKIKPYKDAKGKEFDDKIKRIEEELNG